MNVRPYNFARVPGRGQEQDQEGSSEGEEEEEPIQFQVRMVTETPVTSVAAAGEAHGRRGHQAEDRRARGRGGQRGGGEGRMQAVDRGLTVPWPG